MNPKLTSSLLTLVALTCAPQMASAANSALAFHGSLSATAAISDTYNYLGDTNDSLNLNIAEVTLNTSYRFDNGLRAMGQVYAYKLENYEKLMIDFANVDWQQNEHFGLRLGYSKTPSGFYNEVQDLDTVRPLAFLPIVTYPKAFRPIANNYLGLGTYGTIPAGKGSFEYNFYVGTKDKLNGDIPIFRNQESGGIMRFNDLTFKEVYGGSLIYNTPLEGLRAVLSAGWYPDLKVNGTIYNSTEMAWQPSDNRLAPQAVGATKWNTYLAGTHGQMTVDYTLWRTGLEYTWKDFVFTVEYTGITNGIDTLSAVTGPTPVHRDTASENYYAMVSYQITPKLSAGLSYGEDYANKHDHSGSEFKTVPSHVAYTKDLSVGASYNITDWWQVKVEDHFISGTSLIHNADGWNGDPTRWAKNWNYFVLKTTVSF